MNILLIDHYAGSPGMGMEYRPYYLAEYWIKSGHHVTIIAASYAHVRTNQPQVSADWEEQDLDGVNYLWVRTKPYKGNTVKRFYNIFEFVLKLFFKSRYIARSFTPDVVIASSTYPMDIYPAKRISDISGAKLVYEIHDLWPLSPMIIGGYSKYHPFIMLMQAAENYCYRHADVVISILPKTLDHCVAHGLNPEKWHHVPNGIYVEDSSNTIEIPAEHKAILEQIRKRFAHIVGYTGNIGLANALDTLVLASLKLLSMNTAVVMVGNGPEKENLIKFSSEKNASNVFFLDAVPKKAIPALLAQFDFLFIGWHDLFELYKFGISPNKLMDYMMAARPVIHAVHAGNDLVSEAGCGITVKPEDADSVAEAVQNLISMSNQEKMRMGANGKAYVLKNHEYQVIAGNYLESIALADHSVR
ncbi:MAG TPA: glycosyltransferase family 4 protein [Bacteroidales bacterium]|nr:glycosyltransferase family 4 protein [Bacteroidales bacterium]